MAAYKHAIIIAAILSIAAAFAAACGSDTKSAVSSSSPAQHSIDDTDDCPPLVDNLHEMRSFM